MALAGYGLLYNLFVSYSLRLGVLPPPSLDLLDAIWHSRAHTATYAGDSRMTKDVAVNKLVYRLTEPACYEDTYDVVELFESDLKAVIVNKESRQRELYVRNEKMIEEFKELLRLLEEGDREEIEAIPKPDYVKYWLQGKLDM